jgi:hypothetical protein
MSDERWGVWFQGNGGKVPPHWLLGDDGDWVGTRQEAEQWAARWGREIGDGVARRYDQPAEEEAEEASAAPRVP